MKPVDPRLLRESPTARRSIAVVITAGLGGAIMAIAIAFVLSRVLAKTVQGEWTLSGATSSLLVIAAFAVVRGLMMWVAEFAGHIGAREVIASLRARLLHALADGGPVVVREQRTGALAIAATTGIESLDVYFARYLPQLVLGAAVPILVLIYLAFNDLLSAAIVAVTLPLIPLFMWLIGAAAQHRIDSRWELLQRLGAYFLDIVQGLPTLRIFNRAETQVERVRTVTELSRRATMGTLALAFLSALVLETLASIATALVAAEIGLRLVNGSMTLQTGLAVLIVVPEAYMPLRQLGAFFHSSMEGISAAITILDIVEAVPSTRTSDRLTAVPSLETATIELAAVEYIHPGREEGLGVPITCAIAPRTTTLITGDSGEGKSTLLGLLVPFMTPSSGTVTVDGVDLTDIDPGLWRPQVGWVSQHPSLFAGSFLENLLLGAPLAAEGKARDILLRLFPDEPITLTTPISSDGDGLSGGERTRIALARALLRSPRLLLLDEPTAFLDPRSAITVVSLLEELSATITLVIATHEPERFPWASEIVRVRSGAVSTSDSARPERLSGVS